MWWLEIISRIINMVLMITASAYDIKYKKIPLVILLFDIAVGVIMSLCFRQGLFIETVVKIMPGIIITGMWITGLRIIGPADGLMIIGMGLIMGREEYIVSTITGLLLLWIRSIVLILKGGDKNTKIAFAPFLTMGIITGEILWLV